jgi:hypothetical protein
MKNSTIALIVTAIVILFTLAGLAIVGIKSAIRDAMGRSTLDSVQVIVKELGALYRANPSPTLAEVDAKVWLGLIGSAPPPSAAASAPPPDLYGTRLRVVHSLAGGTHVLTVISAGPDLVFGTSDDISGGDSWEDSNPGKK